MSQGDDGGAERPADPNKQPGPPPNVAPPRPGTPGSANRRPPLPTAAKGTPPPPQDAKPSDGHEEWLEPDGAEEAEEDAQEASLAPATRETSSDDQVAAAGAAAPEPTPPPPAPTPITPSVPSAEIEWREQAPVAPGNAERTKPPSAGDLESTLASAPFRKRSRAKVIGFVLLSALVLVGGGVFYQTQMTARSPTMERVASQSSADTTGRADLAPVPIAEPLPPPTFTPEPPPSASVPKKPAAGADGAASAGATAALSADPSKTGILDTTPLPAGRKMVVDGRVVGTSPRRVVVRCGTHRIRIGDLPPETLDLPCGGEITFTE